MVQRIASLLAFVVAVGLITRAEPAHAKVTVGIFGASNGSLILQDKGPSEINKRITIRQAAGTIKTAAARAFFEKYRIFIGNEVISTGTSGDPNFTHVSAGSLFAGTATFHAAKKGQTVKNFKIQYKATGQLKCKATGSDVSPDYSKATVETQVRFNNQNKFVGTATVDGVTGYDGGTGSFAGAFTGTKYNRAVNKTFKVKLGTLKDKQKFPMVFYGSTLVSYAQDVGVKNCAADFFNSSDFTVPPDEAKRGNVEFKPAKKVNSFLQPQPWPLGTYPDVKVYLEDASSTFLNSIDVNTVQLFLRLGDAGSIQPSGIEETGDTDSDGIPDRALTFDGFTMFQKQGLILLGYLNTDQLTVIGETTGGDVFQSTASFVTQ